MTRRGFGYQRQRRNSIQTQIKPSRQMSRMEGQGILSAIKNLFNRAKTVGQRAFGTAERIYDSDIGTAVRNAIPASDENARPGFPGERHAILRLPNGKYGSANYMGPGTNLIARLKRGDPGRTVVDSISMAHDVRYALAKTQDDVRMADRAMIRAVEQAERDGTDNVFNTRQAKLIKFKNYGEDFGLLKRDAFSGDLSLNENISAEDQALMRSSLSGLEQKGYGLPTDRLMTKIGKSLASRTPSGHVSIKKLLASLGLHNVVSFKKVKQHLGPNPTPTKVLNMLLKLSGTHSISKANHTRALQALKNDMEMAGTGFAGRGFMDGFLKVFKNVAKVAGPILSFIQPEIGIPMTVAANFT